MKTVIKSILQAPFRAFGYQITKLPRSKGSYIDAKVTIEAASASRQTIREYVETLWNQEGQTAKVIEQMNDAGCLLPCNRVLEIGAGTGRYLELILPKVHPQQYEVYELDQDWADYLAHQYAPQVISQPTEGTNLRYTTNESCDLVHAHGVFVYLPVLSAFEYFHEMIRVCKKSGYIVFDFYSDVEFTVETIENWLKFIDRYPVVLPSSSILDFFHKNDCRFCCQFINKHGHGYSTYFVFQKLLSES
jgi:SAM-dependent methyltransferase